MKRIASLLLVALAIMWCGTGYGRSYTPDITAFYKVDPDNKMTVPDISNFRGYAGELAVAMAPKFQGPSATLGSMGYELTLTVGLADISTDTYWRGAARDPGSLLVTNQIRFRKGLPYSFELGGYVTHLYQSDLWAIGLEVGWALHEGFRYFPDIGVLSSVSTVLGSADLAMLEVNVTPMVSKSFSVAGLFTLEPYAGYNMIYINASSHRVAILDADQKLPEAIGMQNIFRHRGVLGLNSVITYLTLGFEVTLGVDQRTYGFKVGTAF